MVYGILPSVTNLRKPRDLCNRVAHGWRRSIPAEFFNASGVDGPLAGGVDMPGYQRGGEVSCRNNRRVLCGKLDGNAWTDGWACLQHLRLF